MINQMNTSSVGVAASSKNMLPPKVIIPMENTNGDYKIYEFYPDQMIWRDIRSIWEKHSIAYPLCFAPPEDRIEIFFFHACQAYGTPCSLGSVYNPSWTDMFLSKVGHDCLVITAPLISYVISNKLFATRIAKLRLLVCIGDINPELKDKLLERFADLKFESLPHPITSVAK